MASGYFFVGQWKVEPELRRITYKNSSVSLEPQLMALLVYLAENQGQVVDKEDIFREVWKEVVVSENVLTRAVSSLRKAFNDHPQRPQFIETISKKGYRLIAPVKYPGKRSEKHIELRFKRRPVVIAVTTLLVLFFGGFAMRQILIPFSGERMLYPQIIAAQNTPEYYPALSSDGKFAAFAARAEGNNWDIYVKRIGTENLVRITDSDALELRPVWSPDGNDVLYLRYEGGEKTIYKTPMTGGPETRVLNAGNFSHGNFDISPDGKIITFNDRPNSKSPLGITLTHLSDGQREFLTTPPDDYNGDIHPTFSSDGERLAFIRERNPTSMYLFVMDLEKRKLKQVTLEHQAINGFDWSEDGKSLIYGADQTGIYKLWKVDINTGKSSLLPAGDYQMVMPRTSTTGEIIYAKLQDDVNIWEFSLDRKEAKAWRSTKSLDINPSVSPDGTKTAFTSNKNGLFELWTSNADGSDEKVIAQFDGRFANTPRWSKSGETILFQGVTNGRSDIFEVDANGGIPVNLTNSRYEEATPIYDGSGETIIYSSNSSGTWQLWKKEIGKRPEQLTTDGGYSPLLSIDQDKVFYVKKERTGLWSLDLESGAESKVIDDFHPMFYGAYTIARDGIFYFNARTRTIDFLDSETGISQVLVKPRRMPRLGITLDFSRISNTLFYSQVDHIDSDIMSLAEQ